MLRESKKESEGRQTQNNHYSLYSWVPPKIVWFWWVTQPANYLKEIQVRYRENKLITRKSLAGIKPSISSSAFSIIGRVKENNICLNQELAAENSRRKSLLETLFLMLSPFFQPNLRSMSSATVCTTSRSQFSSPSCRGQWLHYLKETLSGSS